MAWTRCSHSMASFHGGRQASLPCGMSQIFVAIACFFVCGHLYRHKFFHQHHAKRPHLFWAMAHYIDQAAPWDPNDLVLYVVVRPDPQTTHFHSIVLHYESGWQTWIGLPDGFQEEYDPKNWSILNSLSRQRPQPVPDRSQSSRIVTRTPGLARVPEEVPEEEPMDFQVLWDALSHHKPKGRQ